ncbi:Calcium-dependent channel, 7TM region, putative phosphate [Phytophthora cactorum]|nr:Calcium-dependent channel, 7TM region, putative phosphate [Phytophthora cactorum]
MTFMDRFLLRVVALVAVLAAGVSGDDLSVVNVPSGVTTVMLDGRVELKVDTPVLPGYGLGGTDVDQYYRLGAERSVVSIAAGREEGWQGIWYQLLFNSLIFFGGITFFAWRRLQKLDLPMWMGHQEALFERSNYDDISPDVFNAKYGELQGSTLKERMKRFWNISCNGDYVSSTCGIPAALIMNFYRDCGHLFAFLSFFSLAAMLPVNYVPGSARGQKGGEPMPSQGSVHEITVLRDLSAVHELLDRRKVLSEKLSRILAFDVAYENGTLSYNLLCCPGSVMAPEPLEVAWWHLRCKPGRYIYRHDKMTECCCYCCTCCCPKHSPRAKVKRGSRSDSQFETMEELDFFPEDALEEFGKRKCMGAAFVIFDSTATRNAFVRNVRGQTCIGRLINTAESLSHRGFRERPLASLRKPERSMSDELAPMLRDVVLKSAPEPDDVIWQSLAYRPYTVRRVVVFWLRQVATLALLLLFSTPTAVLMFIKLDSLSYVYRGFNRRNTFLLTMVASYLPSLLLIAVNWCLLAFLYHLTMSEPSFSHSRRVKSFLVKGFTYLVVSSVILPSIGVTAVYLALSDIEKTGGRSYIESFLYKVSGTFFISYVCQRTFLGGIVDITRCADTMALQPWIHSRSITSVEIQKALRPSAFSYGHDYALVLSVFLVILLGTVITPIITPFGALYFYVKYATTKYNVLYVLPYSPGRGHIAGTALELTFPRSPSTSLDSRGRRVPVRPARICGPKRRGQSFRVRVDHHSEATGIRRSMFGPKPTDLQHEEALVASYADPYKAALSIFKLLGVNKFTK